MSDIPIKPATRVNAIHPISGEIEHVYLLSNYFGPNKDAILFKGINQPRWDADSIVYEIRTE